MIHEGRKSRSMVGGGGVRALLFPLPMNGSSSFFLYVNDVWNALVLQLGLPTFVYTGSLGYPPRLAAYNRLG